MDARNRMADVKKLRTNACQDLLSHILVDGWREKLYKIAQTDPSVKVLRRMDDIGVSNYSVSDMDVTLISTIINFHSELLKISLHSGTINAFNKIRDDRNLNSHSGDNEEQEELYLQEQDFLRDLEVFVRRFDENERSKIGNDETLKIRQEYLAKIKELRVTLDNDRLDLGYNIKKRAADIQRIKESKDQRRTWFECIELYMIEMRNKKDTTEFEAFVYEAAEAGIIYAYSSVANNFIIKEDYDKAEKYLRYMYENRHELNTHPEHLMLLADIYIHGKCKNPGDGYAILQTLIDEGYSIVLSEDKTKYQYISKNNGKSYYTIELPQ